MSGVHAAAARSAGGTVERVGRAWQRVGPTTRTATVAAGLTAVLLAAGSGIDGSLRAATIVTGLMLDVAALVDVHEHRLPNMLLAAAFVAAMSGAVAAPDPLVLVWAVTGVVIAGGAVLVVRLTRGVGMGDVKMAGVVGASAGSLSLVAAPVAIAVAAAVAACCGLVTGRQRLPLGPSLWLGWAVSVAAVSAGWPT